MIIDGAVGTCAIIDLEVLYSSRNLATNESVLLERAGFESPPITPDVTNTPYGYISRCSGVQRDRFDFASSRFRRR